MDNREIIAYAVDSDTGKVTWRLYDVPWRTCEKNKAKFIVGE